jgi:hypothetical protein
MSNEKHHALSLWAALVTDGDGTRYIGKDESRELTLDDLGHMAEWLAVAWQNVAGEDYKPVVITERGYVADEGVLFDTPEPEIDRLERDCE